MADRLVIDDRRLLVELQSLGVRVEDERAGPDAPGVQSRRGGAGPSDAGFLWVRGLPLTVPMHAGYVAHSPYVLRLSERGGELFISTAGPRAHQVSEAALGLRGTLTEGPCGCGRTGQRIIIPG